MERRLLLTIVLSILVFYFYNTYFLTPQKKNFQQKHTDSQKQQVQLENNKVENIPDKNDTLKETNTIKTISNTSITQTKFKNDMYEMVVYNPTNVFSNIKLIKSRKTFVKTEKLLELAGLENELQYDKFNVNDNIISNQISINNVPVLNKIVNISQNKYVLNVTFESLTKENQGSIILFLPNKLADEDNFKIVYQTENSKNPMTADNWGQIQLSNFKWFGYRTDDLMLVVLNINSSLKINRLKVDKNIRYGIPIDYTSRDINKFIVYTGPKSYPLTDHFSNMLIDKYNIKDIDIISTIDLSIWGNIRKIIYLVLEFFYRITKNYGLAIICLTILIRTLMWPLTHKQTNSMKKMQVLQPKIKNIREKYKGDATKMNQEIFNLYKVEKVNPMSGCFPLLIQMPILIILYRLLIDFDYSNSPAFLWIDNIGKTDITLIIMLGVTMFIQQKLTPQAAGAADNQQMKMFQYMPFIFVILTYFWKLPSGVLLYWVVSNLLDSGQKIVANPKFAYEQYNLYKSKIFKK